MALRAGGEALRKRWRRWVVLLSRRERGTALALFRIAVAAVVIYSVSSVMVADLVPQLWVDRAHGGMLRTGENDWLLELCGGATRGTVWPFAVATLAAASALMVGVGGRATPLVTLLTYRSISTIGSVSGSYDAMIFNALWLLALGEATATLSFDCRRKTGKWTSDKPIHAWPRYLLIFQLVVIYTATGLQKMSASWTFADGYSALYWFLQDPTWARFDMSWTAHVYPLTQLGTFASWHFEVGAPLLLLVYYYRVTRHRPGRLRALFNRRDLRIGYALVGITLHVSIAVLLDMGPFSWISLAYYLPLWRPRELERVLRLA